MEEVDRDQNKIKHGAETSANSEHPAHLPTPCDCQSLPEGRFLSKQKDAVSALRIVGHKPAEPSHSSGNEKHDRMCGDG